MQPISNALRSAFTLFESWHLSDDTPALFTGLRELDDVIGGLRPGTLTVIEGDPVARGASHLLLGMATSLPAWQKVAYFSLDLSTDHTLVQWLLHLASVNVDDLTAGGEPAERAWVEIIKAAGKLGHDRPSFWLNERYDLSPTQLEGECWKLIEGARERSPSCVAFVDSIHGIRSETGRASDRVCETVDRLAAAAERLRIPIVVTAHGDTVAFQDVEAINVLIRVSVDEPGQGPWPAWPAEYSLEVVRNDVGPCSTFRIRFHDVP